MRSLIAALLVALVGGLLAPVPAAAGQTTVTATETAPPLRIDDSDHSAWTYAGNWESAADVPWTMGQYKNTETWSNETGARAQLQFFGTSASVIGPKGPNGGAFRITLDCTTVVEGTSYMAVKTIGNELATFTGLARGWHTIVVEVIGHAPPGSTNDYVMIDEAKVADDLGAAADPATRFLGADSGTPSTAPVELRRPGCGPASSLVDVIKSRVIRGEFAAPLFDGGSSPTMRVNAVSTGSHPGGTIPAGPVTIDGSAVEAATMPVYSSATRIDLSLPDRPRTLQLEVVADEKTGGALEFAVGTPDGQLLPMVSSADAGFARVAGGTVALAPGDATVVLADLRDVHGAGQFDRVTLWATSSSTAQLDILAGRTSDLAVDRLANQSFGADATPADGTRLAAPPSALLYGPVVLSRVLADYDQPAWAGDQSTPTESLVTGVPLLWGESSGGVPLTVSHTPLSADAVGLRLPAAAPGAGTSSAVLRFDTSRRCRTFTAMVGLDDSSPASSTVSLALYGDGELLTMAHNGTWLDGVSGAGHPQTTGADREALADELLAAKLQAITAADGSTAAQRAALEAIARSQVSALTDQAWDNSAATMTYPVSAPLVFGVQSTTAGSAPNTFMGHANASQGVIPLDAGALFPLSVDLITSGSRELLRTAATTRGGSVHQHSTPLISDLRLVVSGSPGAVLALDTAGLDCVTVEPDPRTDAVAPAMPRWSQLGVPPLFLPAPTNSSGSALTRLAGNPMWWDTVCPQGPSVDGLSYAGVRERETSYRYSTLTPQGQLIWKYEKVVERSTASNPACGFPADQLATAYSEYSVVSGGHIPDGAQVSSVTTTDPVREKYDLIGADWSTRVIAWMKGVVAETITDSLTWAIWIVMVPFDPVGAVLFNPFTLHALPWEAQVALGLAYGAASAAAEGALVRAIPAATTAATSGAPLDELLMTTLARAKVEVDQGSAALLDLEGGGRLLVPLGPSKLADVEIASSTTPFVDADRATQSMPRSGAPRVPWFSDVGAVTGEEISGLCSRDVEMKCSTSGGPEVAPSVRASRTWRGGGLATTKVPPVTSVDANVPSAHYATGLGYGERYEGAGTLPTAVMGTPEAASAVEAMSAMRNTTSVDVTRAYLTIPESTTRVQPVVALDNRPLYRFDTRAPEQVFATGFGLHPAAVNGSDTFLDVYESAQVGVSPGSAALMKSTTRDPDMLAAGFNSAGFASHWRYKIARPAAGGGIDVRATFRYGLTESGNTSVELAFQADSEVIRGEAEVLFPGGISSQYIERADYVEWNPAEKRFEVIASYTNANFDASIYPNSVVPPISEAERVGATRPDGVSWVKFDWPQNGSSFDYFKEIPSPPSDLLRSRKGIAGAELVYLKNLEQWVLLPNWAGVTKETLSQSGFLAGYLTGIDPRVRVWVPKYMKYPPGFRFSESLNRTTRDEPVTPAPVIIAGPSGALQQTANPYAPAGANGGVFDVVFSADTPTSWTMEQRADGTIRLLNPATGTALQVTNETAGDGERIVVASPASWDFEWQRWTMQWASDGVIIRSVAVPDVVLRAPLCAPPCTATATASDPQLQALGLQ